uniref:UDENN domain-containing protein n=1 Tax=Denticeps clupeoides TaxID=299321 RepID=A0AAY4C3S1_9TELE
MSREAFEGNSSTLGKLGSLFSNLQKLQRGRTEKTPALPPSSSLASAGPRSHDPGHLSGQFFFEYLVVVGLKRKAEAGSYEPQITYQFPKRDSLAKFQKEEEEKSLKAIALFCFPEGVNWAPLTEYPSETFSFVLTEVDGSRRNGYCRRLLPSGRGARPPEAYCIISRLACFGLFSKIFDEVEKRRQKSMAMIYPFMQSLREAPVPAPGNTVKITSFIPESGTEIISLTRPVDSRLEHVDFRALFRCLGDEEVLEVFAATVLERRIIFIADELSTLSQVLHAVAALLYPFAWQHTFISIVPTVLIDVVMAPTPYLLGITSRMRDSITDTSDVSGRQVTIATSCCLCCAGELNKVVSEAFLSFFVKTVGHFTGHVRRRGGSQTAIFHKEKFCKAAEPKANRPFVTLFSKTQMFDIFIQHVERNPHQEGFFHKKIAAYQKAEKTKGGWARGRVV